MAVGMVPATVLANVAVIISAAVAVAVAVAVATAGVELNGVVAVLAVVSRNLALASTRLGEEFEEEEVAG